MFRFLLALLLIALLSWLLPAFMPWWLMPVAVFLVALAMLRLPGRAFVAGCLGVASIWTILLLSADAGNEHILSARMAKLFGLGSSGLFLAVNILAGALIGGLAAWSGALVNRAFRKPRERLVL